jgi:anti-anti-sigma factor
VNISQHRHGAVTVVRPEGPLAGDDAEGVRHHLLETIADTLGRCVLDASAIAFVDSKGLEALLDVSELMAQSGQTLKMCGLNETVRQVLELTDLAPMFEYFEDAIGAARSFL